MLTQDEVLDRLIEFYHEFEFEFSQYDYEDELYYPILIDMGQALEDSYGLPAELLINFARQVH